MKSTSVHIRGGQDSAIDDIVRESLMREDVPELSRSDVIRRLIDSGLESSEIGDLVGEAAVVRHRKDRFLEDEGWLRNQRTGFETQVQRHFRNRFENGFSPEQLDEWAENMRQLAFDLWPPDVGDDYTERREEALAYVDSQLEAAKNAADDSAVDPLDPEGTYEDYTGVENGRGREKFSEIVSEANDRLTGGVYRDPDAVVQALTNEFGVPHSVALEAVEQADGGSTEVSEP